MNTNVWAATLDIIIGSTCRAFKTRRLEHLGRTIHTGRPITNPSISNIREHAEQESHPLSHSNFKIIRSMPDKTSLLIAESLHIKFNNPSLNNHATSFPLIISDKIWFYVLLLFTMFLCFIFIRSYWLTTVYLFFEKILFEFQISYNFFCPMKMGKRLVTRKLWFY